jgi:hypothetical protein
MKKLFLFLFVFFILISFISGENLTCEGEVCNRTKTSTYDENVLDKNCYYKINFCNLGFGVKNISDNAAMVINTLKYTNYQMSDELDACKSKQTSPFIIYYFLGLILIVQTFIIYKIYLKKDGNRETKN